MNVLPRRDKEFWNMWQILNNFDAPNHHSTENGEGARVAKISNKNDLWNTTKLKSLIL